MHARSNGRQYWENVGWYRKDALLKMPSPFTASGVKHSPSQRALSGADNSPSRNEGHALAGRLPVEAALDAVSGSSPRVWGTLCPVVERAGKLHRFSCVAKEFCPQGVASWILLHLGFYFLSDHNRCLKSIDVKRFSCQKEIARGKWQAWKACFTQKELPRFVLS